MPFGLKTEDFTAICPRCTSTTVPQSRDQRTKSSPKPKSNNGAVNYQAGISAERIVCRHYLRNGARFREHRWRGPGGEIDLILSDGDQIVFVEVKKSKSHRCAFDRITKRQLSRIGASALAYIEQLPSAGLTNMRIDVAVVDARGSVEIVSNVEASA